MKPLTLEEVKLKEEMKERCLNKRQYIDENAKAKFDMLCRLEDFEVQYWELKKENEQLKDNWNKLKKFLKDWEENEKYCYLANSAIDRCRKDIYGEVLDKMQELEGSEIGE